MLFFEGMVLERWITKNFTSKNLTFFLLSSILLPGEYGVGGPTPFLLLEKGMREKELEIVKDTVETLGFVLVDAFFQGGRRPSSLTVVIYRKEREVTSADCEQVSQVIGERLAVEVGFDYDYALVVESPGVDRKLKNLREVEIFLGKPVRLVVKNFQEYGLKDSVVLTKIERIEGNNLVFTHEGKSYAIPWERFNQVKLHFDIKEYLKEEE
jgi:ribosome maturation factor RimP